MTHALVIGVEPQSLIHFRGALLSDLVTHKVDVGAVSLPISDEVQQQLTEKNVSHHAITFERNGLNPIADMKTFIALWRLFRQQRPDFVLSYTIKPVIWGGLAARLLNIRFYALITGLGFAFQGKTWRRKLLTTLVSALYKLALSKADKVIFQNNDNRLRFIELKIVADEKTAVVNGSGVDIDAFSYQEPTAPVDNAVVFLCIARLLGEKGLREYAQAAMIVKRTFPQAQFWLVGPQDSSPDGIALTEVNDWVKQGYIHYLGATKDVRPYLQACHVYVLPSYHEGLPRSTIEAMAVGRAIVTTNAVGCKETVEEGVNGFKIDVKDSHALADRLIELIEHPAQIPIMGLASRQLAEQRFDVRQVNAQLLTLMRVS